MARGAAPRDSVSARPRGSLPRNGVLAGRIEIVRRRRHIGRAIGGLIILLFCAALIRALAGTIDIVASATGKIVRSGRTEVIQPFETGVVRSIRRRTGRRFRPATC